MKKAITYLSAFGALLTVAPQVWAQEITIAIQAPPNLPAGARDIGTLIGRSLGLVLILAGLATFMYLIWGGVEWITSGGDKGKVEAAQHRIQAALLGLFIVFAAWALMSLVGGFFGFSLTNIVLPSLK